MNRDRLGELRVECPGSSWAVWSEEFPADDCLEQQPDKLTEFIEARSECLQPGIILVSHSNSDGKPLGYRDFHSPNPKSINHDLKEIIQGNNLDVLRGAYMTRILPNGSWDGTAPLETNGADVGQFLDQVRALGQSQYAVICLSKPSFTILNQALEGTLDALPHGIHSFSTELDAIDLTVYNVGTDVERTDTARERLETQLQFLNSTLEK